MVGLNFVFDVLYYPIYVSTLVGEFVVVTHVYCSYLILFFGFSELSKFDYSRYVRLLM